MPSSRYSSQILNGVPSGVRGLIIFSYFASSLFFGKYMIGCCIVVLCCVVVLLGSLSKGVFERRTATENKTFSLLLALALPNL